MNWSNGKPFIFAAAATAASVGMGLWMICERRKRQAEEEQRYELVGQVSGLSIFPVKSCAGIETKEGLVTKDGFMAEDLADRHFLLIRANGDFVTQRQFAMISAIKTSMADGYLILSSDKTSNSVKVPIRPKVDQSKIINCRIWNGRLPSIDLGDEASAWISDLLQEEGIRIVTVVPGTPKLPAGKPNAEPTDKITYQDAAPMHIATEASLADLVSRIPDSAEDGKINMSNFRPNIVISGSKAWDEDSWSFLKIGDSVKLRLYTPCDRCLLTTVNQGKHQRRNDGEPLTTLRTFRMMPEISKSPMFGVYTGVDAEGTVRVGDPVYALRK